nr:ATP-binding protein [Marinicella sp. W31]MDC2877893.1 ATP-binding protein [Marinicella sp. W31]
MSGYAQLLERDPTIPEARQPAIKSIRRSADYLSGLIDGLLDISRIESGRLQVFSNEINLTEFLDQIIDMFETQARAKGLKFENKLDRNLPAYVRTDEKRLRQILVNLLSNAVKFTDTGSVTLSARYRSQVATFTVADTGSGIAEEDLSRIYEPFERGGGRSEKPGLGLGLTITRLLVNTLGGEIEVESKEEAGTRFTVRLMLASIERPQPARIAGDTAATAGYGGPRRTVMVVDDNADHRAMMRDILVPLGFNVLTVEDGETALDQLEDTMPDLFLLDIRMPGMNGWQLATTLRDQGITSPIVMLSANIGDDAIIGHGDDSHNDTLSKPVDLKRLRDVLALHLGINWQATPAAPDSETATPPQSLQSPPKSDIVELIRLGEIGYHRGIRDKLAALSADEAYQPFVSEATTFVTRFDMDGLVGYLKSLKSGTAGKDAENNG